jgi:predicted GNAT family N-acyltransferase
MNREVRVSKVTEANDLAQASVIRKKVFVDEQGCPPELEVEHDSESNHFLATVDGVPAGASRWRKTDNGYKLERFAVLKEYRGFGVGQAMIKAVVGDLPKDAGKVYLHAQIQAVRLYEKSNFKKEGPEFEEAGIRHYKMVWMGGNL